MRVYLFKPPEDLIDGNEVGNIRASELDVIEGNALPAASPFMRPHSAAVIDENLAHLSSHNSKEMSSVFISARAIFGEPDENLVDESGRLQGMSCAFLAKKVSGHAAELAIGHVYGAGKR